MRMDYIHTSVTVTCLGIAKLVKKYLSCTMFLQEAVKLMRIFRLINLFPLLLSTNNLVYKLYILLMSSIVTISVDKLPFEIV